jgi:hypothetical protein
MKKTHRSAILLGMGILCAGTFVTNIESASAAPNKYEGRRDDRDRRDRDDRDRRDRDRWDRDRRDRDRRDDRRPDWNGGYRPNYNQGDWNRGNRSSTLEGVVTQDLKGNSFIIRTNNGRQIRIIARGGESRRISRGDVVRVYGNYAGNSFNAQSVNILRNR